MSSRGLCIFFVKASNIFLLFKDSSLSFSQRHSLSSLLLIPLAFKASVLLTNYASSTKSIKLNKLETFAMSLT